MKKPLLLLCMLLSFTSAVLAQVPTVMMYQVQVNHGESQPKDVSIEMQLRKSQYGAAIWSQVFDFTEMKNYTVVNLALDLGDKFDWNDGEYWLATLVDGNEMGCAQLTSVPYAYCSKYVEGALTAKELIGKWSWYDPDDDFEPTNYEFEFGSDGTFIYTRTGYVYYKKEWVTTTRSGKWNLNGAGNLYFECYREDGTLYESDVVATYLNRENGHLKVAGGDGNIFYKAEFLTKEKK